MPAIRHPETGEDFELTPNNTTVMLFSNHLLDHVGIELDDGKVIACYDQEAVRSLTAMRFPVYMRFDAPEWAIERRVMAEANDHDIESLLGGEQ